MQVYSVVIVQITLTGGEKRKKGKKKKLPVKIQGDCYSFYIVESEYDNQITILATKVKEKGLNSKTTFIIKVICCFLIVIYIVSNNEQCLYIQYPKYKEFIKYSFLLL